MWVSLRSFVCGKHFFFVRSPKKQINISRGRQHSQHIDTFFMDKRIFLRFSPRFNLLKRRSVKRGAHIKYSSLLNENASILCTYAWWKLGKFHLELVETETKQRQAFTLYFCINLI